jgi:hypothetical protein
MIVVIRPGGTVRDLNVVLRPDELLPNRHNTKETIVYRESRENPREWVLVKPHYSVLPEDSAILSQPELPETQILDLTTTDNSDTLYEHLDIIRFDKDKDDE